MRLKTVKNNPLDTIKEGLNNPKEEQQRSKIDLDKAGETAKKVSAREPFRVTSITFFKTDDNQ